MVQNEDVNGKELQRRGGVHSIEENFETGERRALEGLDLLPCSQPPLSRSKELDREHNQRGKEITEGIDGIGSTQLFITFQKHKEN